MAELRKCSQERGAAESRILNSASCRAVADQNRLLATRDLARMHYDAAHAALGTYRESLREKTLLENGKEELVVTYLAASRERDAALNTWSGAPYADKIKLMPILAEANLRLSVAYEALEKFWPEKTFSKLTT